MSDGSSLFQEAANFVEESVQLGIDAFESDEIRLRLYGLYKQSLFGPVHDPQPSIFQPKQRAKWNAWNDVRDYSQKQAEDMYVQLVTELCPEWQKNERTSTGNSAGPVFSRLVDTAETDDDSNDQADSKSKDILALLVSCEMNVGRFLESMKVNEMNIAEVDSSGRHVLHWAVDEGSIEAVSALLMCPIDINSQDKEGMTALHYATLCEHQKIAQMLVSHGALSDIPDSSGERPIDIAPASWNLTPS